ncbi:family 16 glycosylhydrolase, partial [bacterium]|nr:family 16 glycosylhydrolase [bacterium]
ADIDEVGWPQCGEIDIMEFRGQEPNVNHGSLHGPGHSGANAYTQRYVLPQGRLDNGFHTYAIEWTPDSIDWYLDDVLFHSGGPEDIEGEWVYDHPFYLILNIAVGGGFVGPVGPDTEFPQDMIIDYVRVYEDAR